MLTLEDIKEAILRLRPDEVNELWQWLDARVRADKIERTEKAVGTGRPPDACEAQHGGRDGD